MSEDNPMRAFAVAGFIAGCLTVVPACAQAPVLPANLPASLKPDGMSPYLQVLARGTQIYACGKNDAGAWTWIFKAPDARLFDATRKQVGRHYAGPTWEALAGGKVVGATKASAPGAAGAVPWLLLEVKSRDGSGPFTDAKAILRIETTGGVAPVKGCNWWHRGKETRVPYMAKYVFLK
jgi:hypothetical protein